MAALMLVLCILSFSDCLRGGRVSCSFQLLICSAVLRLLCSHLLVLFVSCLLDLSCVHLFVLLLFLLDSLRGSSVKIGTIQRRLAWPLRKDDTHKSRSVILAQGPC